MLLDDEETDFSKGPIPWTCSGRFDDPDHPTDSRLPYPCLLLRTSIIEEATDGKLFKETFLILSRGNESLKVKLTDHERFRRIGIASFRGKNRMFVDNVKRKTLSLI